MRDWRAEFDEAIGPLSSDQLATIRRLSAISARTTKARAPTWRG